MSMYRRITLGIAIGCMAIAFLLTIATGSLLWTPAAWVLLSATFWLLSQWS